MEWRYSYDTNDANGTQTTIVGRILAHTHTDTIRKTRRQL